MGPRGDIFILGLVLSIAVLLISVLISAWARRLTRDLGDYYVAGRSVGAWNNGLAMVSLGLSLTTFIGLTAFIIQGMYIGVAVYASFTASFIGMMILAAPYLRRHKSFTTMAFIAERYYSRNLRIVSVVIMLVVSALYLVANFKGIGIVFYYLLGVPETWGILVGGLVVTLYVTIFSGMYGVTFNQTFQTIVLLFCLLCPVAAVLRALGSSGWAFPPLGYGDMVPKVVEAAPHYFWPMVEHPVTYLAIFLCFFLGIIGLPHFVMRFFTVRDAREARWSTVICIFLVGLVNTAVYATGLAAVYWVKTTGLTVNPGELDYMVFELIEKVAGQGWLAIAVAGALAAGLSTVAGLLMIMGAGLIHDLYGSIRPAVDDNRKLKFSYAAMFVVGIVVIILSILKPPELLLKWIMWAFGIAAAGLGVPIVLGIWWKRTNKYGAAAGMIAGFLIAFIGFILVEVAGINPVELPIPFLAKYLYGEMGWIKITAIAVPVSLILTVVVSWLTSPPPAEVQRSVDVMHGWPDSEPRRYSGAGLPVVLIVLSVFILWFMTTSYGYFPL